jgi:hypothetical protein
MAFMLDPMAIYFIICAQKSRVQVLRKFTDHCCTTFSIGHILLSISLASSPALPDWVLQACEIFTTLCLSCRLYHPINLSLDTLLHSRWHLVQGNMYLVHSCSSWFWNRYMNMHEVMRYSIHANNEFDNIYKLLYWCFVHLTTSVSFCTDVSGHDWSLLRV